MRIVLSIILFLFLIPAYATEPDTFVTPKDNIPNFAKNPTIKSVQTGGWFDTATWDLGRYPQSDDVVLIDAGHVVTFNGISAANIAAIGVKGDLVYSQTNDRSLKAGTVVVYREGRLEIGNATNPFPAQYTAELIIADRPLYTTTADPVTGTVDPYQYGTGLIALGTVEMHGRNIGDTFAEMAADAMSGTNTVTLVSVPSEWAVGDVVYFPDTRQVPLKRKWQSEPLSIFEYEIESREITAISGNTITLDSNLTYSHKLFKDSANNTVLRPHLANSTRNIILRSENAESNRAHTMFTERADVDVRFVKFKDMGRTTHLPLDSTTESNGVITHVGTNQIGRYPVHFHMHMGPVNPTNTGYQSHFVGNAIMGCEKWCASWHEAPFFLAENNFGFDATGSIFMTERGNETGGTFKSNIGMKSGFPSDHFYEVVYGGVTRPLKQNSFGDFGYEGSIFWFNGNDLIVEDNVAANAAYALYMFNARSPSGFGNHQPKIPLIRGANYDTPTEWKQYDGTEWAPSIISFKDNVGYMAANGLWNSFYGDLGVIENTTLAHIRQKGVYSQRGTRSRYVGLTIVNDQSVSNAHYSYAYNKGIDLATESIYHAGQNTFEDVDIEGFTVGVKLSSIPNVLGSTLNLTLPPVTAFINGRLQNYANIWEFSPRHAPKNTVFKNFKLITASGPSNPAVSSVPADVIATLESPWTDRDILEKSQLFFLDHSGVTGDNFKYYFFDQDPDMVMPQRIKPGGYVLTDQQCPTLGLTNAECQAAHNKSILDDLAPCTDTTTRSSFKGFTCDITDTTEPDALLNSI